MTSPRSTPISADGLIDRCNRYAVIIEGIVVVPDDWQPGGPERKEPRTTLLEAADELERAAKRIGELEEALRPFAVSVGAVSLTKALGHITREHLLVARAAPAERGTVEKTGDGQ